MTSTGSWRHPRAAPVAAASPRRARSAAVVAAVLLTLAAAACRQPVRLDMERADREIAASLTRTYDLPADRVRCPARVPAEEGASFTCTVRLGGQEVEVEVTQRSSDGDLRVAPTSAVLVMSEVREDLKRQIGERLGKEDLRAGCGSSPLLIMAPGETFECKVSAGGDTRMVTVEVLDATGKLHYTVQPAD